MKQIYTFRSATKDEQNYVGYYRKLTDGQENAGIYVSTDETPNFCPYKVSTMCKNLKENFIYDLHNGFEVEMHINDDVYNIQPGQILETADDIINYFFKDAEKPILNNYLASKIRSVTSREFYESHDGGLKVTDEQINKIDDILLKLKCAANYEE